MIPIEWGPDAGRIGPELLVKTCTCAAAQAFTCAGYSEKTAYRIWVELLQKTSVAEAIAAAQVKREPKVC